MNWFTRKIAGVRRRASDAWWERHFRVDTTGLRPGPVADGNWYATTPYRSIFQVLDALNLREADVLFDLGCGKGRVLLAASRSPVRRLVGIDLNPELADIARHHLGRLPAAAHRFEIRNQNVLDVDYDDATALFLFDPFGAQTLLGVLERLRDSVARHPRDIRLAFVLACTPESLTVLNGAGWLHCTRRFEILAFGSGVYAVTIWSSARAP